MAISPTLSTTPRTTQATNPTSSQSSTWHGRLLTKAAETCKKIGTVVLVAIALLVAGAAATACLAGTIGFLTGVSFLPYSLGLYLVGVIPKISTVAMSVLAPLSLLIGGGAVFAAITSLLKKNEPVAPAQAPKTHETSTILPAL